MPQGKNQVVLCNFLLGHRKPRIRYVETTNISRRYSWLWLQAGIKLFYRLFYDALFFFSVYCQSSSLVPRPVRAIRVTRGGLEPSAMGEFSRQA